MVNGLEKTISNWEEIQPQPRKFEEQSHKGTRNSIPLWLRDFVVKDLAEFPLIVFTLCGQMAAGLAVFGSFFQLSSWQLLLLGGLLALAALASLAHLGTPRNAWRAVSHLKKSWLSREILTFGLFGTSWLAWLAENWFFKTNYGSLSTALLGLGLVHSMAQVYRIKAVPAWNSWRTNAAFFLSAGVLGLTGAAGGTQLTPIWFLLWVWLAAEAGLELTGQKSANETGDRLRVAGLVLAMVGVGFLPIAPVAARMWLSASISTLILLEELLGRWQFYRALKKRAL
jgi:DMSO reductase anchor subunit